MVVSSGFLDHVLTMERSDVYLRANGLISTAAQPINNTVNRQQQSQSPPASQQTTNSSIMQTAVNVKANNSNNVPQPARVILICHANSHPFQKRSILLEPRQEAKIGRTVPRSRVEETNAIFDCKVLSRNHAIIWYADGKFFIKDTGSSNGTFINNQRIKSSEPYEISSNDIVQFGVDVIENSRKETHGCIIAILKLITPDGIEKTSSQLSTAAIGCSFDSDVYRLKQIMQESHLREVLLEEKLVNLQKEVLATWKNSSITWRAMINEDLLLSRIDILENKLMCYQKNVTNEKLQEQVNKLQDEKEIYQKTAKEALRKVYEDRLEVIEKFAKFERFWQASEDELVLLRTQLGEIKDNNDKLNDINSTSESMHEQLARQESNCKAIKESFEAARRETNELKAQLQIIDDFNEDDLFNTENGLRCDKNRNFNKQQEIMHWLNNSDLKHLKDSDQIINAMCNDTKNKEFLKTDPSQCSRLHEKLLDIEKRLRTATANSTATLDNQNSIVSIKEMIKNCDEAEHKSNDDSNHNKDNGDCKVIDDTKEANANDVHVIDEQHNENNVANDDDQEAAMIRGIFGELKDVYNDFLLQVRLVQKDLIRASKYDELESKFIGTMLELQSLQKEKRREQLFKLQTNNDSTSASKKTSFITSQDYAKTDLDCFDDASIDDSTTLADDIILLNTDSSNESSRKDSHTELITPQNSIHDVDDSFDPYSESILDELTDSKNNCTVRENVDLNHSLEEHRQQIKESNGDGEMLLEKHTESIDSTNQQKPNHVDSVISLATINALEAALKQPDQPTINDGYIDEKEALESFDRIIEEECKLINETDILREEELVELKEKCIRLTDDNIALRHEVANLRLSSNKQFTVLMYTAAVAVFIGYLFSILFS